MSKGLLIGRFQPFHLGHLSAIKQAFRKVDFLYIGIGSAQYSHTPDNPFSDDERAEMIRKSLMENEILEDQYEIISIPDIHDNPKWPAHVRSLIPSFDMLFVGNDGLVKELFEKYDDVPIKKVEKEIDICATDIRKMMVDGSDFQKHIPPACAEYLEEIDAISHLKDLSRQEDKPS